MFDFLDELSSAIAAIGAEIAQVLVFLFNLIVQVAQFIWKTLVAVGNFFFKVVSKAGSFFHHLWDGFFKGIWTKFLSVLHRIHDFLEEKLGPILRFLKKVRAFYDRWFKLYIKPILNMLQKIRQALFVLKLLHIKWAAALDAKILQIETTLTRNFLQMRGIVNALIGAVNAVIDAPLLIRKPTQVLAMRRVFYSLVRVFTGLPPSFWFPSPRKSAPRGLKPPPAGHSFLEEEFNPPASFYLTGFDGLNGFDGFVSGEIPEDGAVDDLELLDFFDDSLYETPVCTDVASCLAEAIELALTTRSLGASAG